MRVLATLAWLAVSGCVATEVGNPGLDPDIDLGGVVVRPPDMVLNPLDAVFDLGPGTIDGEVAELWVWNLSRGGPPITAPVAADGSASVFVALAYSQFDTTTWFGLELRSARGFERFVFTSLEEGRGLAETTGCFTDTDAQPAGDVALESTCPEPREVTLSFAVGDDSSVDPNVVTLSPTAPTVITVSTSGDDVLIGREPADGPIVGAIRVR